MSTVDPKADRIGRHPGHTFVIIIVDFQCDGIGSKIATHSVIELYFNEIIMSGSLPSLFELYNQ